MKVTFNSLTCRVLAHLLQYPDQQYRQQIPQFIEFIDQQSGLSSSVQRKLIDFLQQMHSKDGFEVESDYVDIFDRGRSTSLHLFEHIHGDSRERGSAMIDLLQTYEQSGLLLEDGELPDYLPVVLEFASTQDTKIAQDFLLEISHILNSLHTALSKHETGYRFVIEAILELIGESVVTMTLEVEPEMDQDWQEPAAFSGCQTAGQNKPNQPQPIHIVRKTPKPLGEQQ